MGENNNKPETGNEEINEKRCFLFHGIFYPRKVRFPRPSKKLDVLLVAFGINIALRNSGKFLVLFSEAT
jgi:hypothetical protein